MFVDDRNSLFSGIDGYVVGYTRTLAPSSWVPNGLLNLRSNLRTIEFYHMSATVGGSYKSGQRLFMGLATLTSQRGLAVVSTSASCSSDISQCGAVLPSPGPIVPGSTTNPAPGGDSCCLLAPQTSLTDAFAGVTGSAYLDGVGLLGLITYSLSTRGPALGAFKEDGSVLWRSTGVNFISHVNQPNPTIDPISKNVYWIGVLQTGEVTQQRIYCVSGTTGVPCAKFNSADNGNALNVQAAFGGQAGCVGGGGGGGGSGMGAARQSARMVGPSPHWEPAH